MRRRILNSEFLIPNFLLLALATAVGVAAQGGLTTNGGISFINPGSPTVTDAEAASRPVPRLPDGTVDFTGPWIGGGAIQDIEANGGLKPGENTGTGDLMEFICHENNQYGSAGQFRPGTGTAR